MHPCHLRRSLEDHFLYRLYKRRVLDGSTVLDTPFALGDVADVAGIVEYGSESMGGAYSHIFFCLSDGRHCYLRVVCRWVYGVTGSGREYECEVVLAENYDLLKERAIPEKERAVVIQRLSLQRL